jgi:hypothetical protein
MTDPVELSVILAQVGLSQYEDRLRQNGFEDVETLMLITQSDMVDLGFRLGDHRKLERAVREYSSARGLDLAHEYKTLTLSSDVLQDVAEQSNTTLQSSQQETRTTRPYRHHPRPDSNAPSRP